MANIYEAHPFDLSIENQYKNQATPVLYIVSYPNNGDDSQNIRFRFVNRTGKVISLKPLPAGSGAEQPQPYHFALVFRPGTLFYTNKEDLRGKFETALAAEKTYIGQWSVSDPTEQADGTEIIFLRYTDNKDLTIQNEISFLVKGLTAKAATGSRSTQVQLLYREPVGGEYVTRVRNQHLDIVNHDGKTFAPLDFLVLGSPTLVHRSHDNTVRIQMVETKGRKNIQVTQNTYIDFRFPYYTGSFDPNYHPAWVLGNNDLVNKITLAKDDKEKTPVTSENGDIIDYTLWGYRVLRIKFTRVEDINQLLLKINQVPADGYVGEALIKISICNLPGYWDTDFEVKLQKSLVSTQYINNSSLNISRDYGMLSGQVVVGEDIPKQVSGANDWNTKDTLSSVMNITSAKINDKSATPTPVNRLLRLHDKAPGMNGLDISVGKDTPNEKKADFLIKAGQYDQNSERFLVKPSGEVQASDFITSEKGFQVKKKNETNAKFLLGYNGDILTDGTIHSRKGFELNEHSIQLDSNGNYSGNIYSRFSVKSGGHVSADGNIKSTGGRLEDKTGVLMPVGAVIAYAGSRAPEGWRICDGGILSGEEKYNDLRRILDGNVLPDLRSRFIVGVGQGQNLQNYILKEAAGNEKTKLTVENLPSHSHDINHPKRIVSHRRSFEGSDDSRERTIMHLQNDNDKILSGELLIKGTKSVGENKEFENRPPYYALYYIIKY